MRKFWHFLKKTIKRFNSPLGLIALIVSFMIYVGWALLFIGYGVITGRHWFTGIGTAVVLFWTGPFTPMWALIIITALWFYKAMKKVSKKRKERWLY